jgi:hypothetical protein
MSEKLGVGWLDVLGDLSWWTEEDSRPEVWDAGDDLLPLVVEWRRARSLILSGLKLQYQ